MSKSPTGSHSVFFEVDSRKVFVWTVCVAPGSIRSCVALNTDALQLPPMRPLGISIFACFGSRPRGRHAHHEAVPHDKGMPRSLGVWVTESGFPKVGELGFSHPVRAGCDLVVTDDFSWRSWATEKPRLNPRSQFSKWSSIHEPAGGPH